MGDVSACPYGVDCRFNHDVASFLQQKPPDLPGSCPYLAYERSCPYGLACRFAGSHDKPLGISGVEGNAGDAPPNEVNSLSKEAQKLLWKNKKSFPKADAQLQALGILGKTKHPTDKEITLSTNQNETKVKTDDNEIIQEELEKSSDVCRNRSAAAGIVMTSPPVKRARIMHDDKSSEEKADSNIDELIHLDSDSADHGGLGLSNFQDEKEIKLSKREKKIVDFKRKLVLAPLTTVGNLPFRRVCKKFGADITCGEMAMCSNLLQGQASEWALLRRHQVEDVFGIQLCGSHPDALARTAELIEKECTVDFIDINLGCPIDIVVSKGAGSCLLTKPSRLEQIVRATSAVIENPLTLKVRTGYFEGKNCAHSLIPEMHKWGATAVTVHGRTRQQRYSKLADWGYIYNCAAQAPKDLQVIGNGDIFSFTDWNYHLDNAESKLSTCMIARGALIKPWIFTEIKDQRHWDITSGERLNILRDFVHYGLEHWGSDSKGVETTRRFLLESLSHAHRYIPVGLLEVIPQQLNWRPPSYVGRNDLETLMASDSAADWVRISEMLLGPVPSGFMFTPKHKSNAYEKAENG
ncbi:hypothetical protein O6H91_01G067100 [Diphasiastrum complanatum]|nr:hypothetical protein O6H91_01G067100 [Diphasiastrum complanatum]